MCTMRILFPGLITRMWVFEKTAAGLRLAEKNIDSKK